MNSTTLMKPLDCLWTAMICFPLEKKCTPSAKCRWPSDSLQWFPCQQARLTGVNALSRYSWCHSGVPVVQQRWFFSDVIRILCFNTYFLEGNALFCVFLSSKLLLGYWLIYDCYNIRVFRPMNQQNWASCSWLNLKLFWRLQQMLRFWNDGGKTSELQKTMARTILVENQERLIVTLHAKVCCLGKLLVLWWAYKIASKLLVPAVKNTIWQFLIDILSV